MSEPEKKEPSEAKPHHPDHPHGHPLGTGIGTAGGAATGAAIGAMAGPIGAVIGAVAGGIVGGLTGRAVAESIDPKIESEYWEKHFLTRPYVEAGTFEDYGPAYQYGWETRSCYPGKTFEEVEANLATGWEAARGDSKLDWDRARHAAQDAWHRLHRLSSMPIDEHGGGVTPQ
jgi:hypothetical protein